MPAALSDATNNVTKLSKQTASILIGNITSATIDVLINLKLMAENNPKT
jgi:hypothetical protein